MEGPRGTGPARDPVIPSRVVVLSRPDLRRRPAHSSIQRAPIRLRLTTRRPPGKSWAVALSRRDLPGSTSRSRGTGKHHPRPCATLSGGQNTVGGVRGSEGKTSTGALSSAAFSRWPVLNLRRRRKKGVLWVLGPSAKVSTTCMWYGAPSLNIHKKTLTPNKGKSTMSNP